MSDLSQDQVDQIADAIFARLSAHHPACMRFSDEEARCLLDLAETVRDAKKAGRTALVILFVTALAGLVCAGFWELARRKVM